MKRKYLWIMLVILVITVVCCICFVNKNPAEPAGTVEAFDVGTSYYQERIEHYSGDLLVNAITDKNTAVQEAEKIFIQEYDIQPSNYKPYTVNYDSVNDVWLIWTQPVPSEPGGVAFGGGLLVLIHSNGEVLAVWREK